MDTRRRTPPLADAALGVLRVAAADDHPLIRAGLATVIASETDMRFVGEAANGEEALERYRALRPDVMLMDLRMPVMDGVAAMRAILAEHPDARLVALTTYDGYEDIYRALEAGARGYLLKDMIGTELTRVIRQVARGERAIPAPVAARLAEHTPRIELTDREREVLALVARGFSNREIAQAIGRTEPTAKVHLRNILAKLGVDDRTHAVTLALQRGILHLD